MKISKLMSPEVRIVSPDDTIQAAAQKMEDADVGFLPVGENDQLIGMVTDRDIALRAVAEGKDPKKTKVRDVMTERVLYCQTDDDVDSVADNMAEMEIRRMPIIDENKRLVGVVSIGDIAIHKAAKAGSTLKRVCANNMEARA